MQQVDKQEADIQILKQLKDDQDDRWQQGAVLPGAAMEITCVGV